MIHIYEGDGKGKTTAAYGLALRAYGSGMKVCIAGFLKPEKSGEYRAITSALPQIKITYFGGGRGFVGQMSVEDEQKTREQIRKGFFSLAEESYGLLILDEIIDCVNFGFITEDELISFLFENKSEDIVLTGRNPSEKLTRTADYYTFFKKIKHPFDKGISARKGIEY